MSCECFGGRGFVDVCHTFGGRGMEHLSRAHCVAGIFSSSVPSVHCFFGNQGDRMWKERQSVRPCCISQAPSIFPCHRLFRPGGCDPNFRVYFSLLVETGREWAAVRLLLGSVAFERGFEMKDCFGTHLEAAS